MASKLLSTRRTTILSSCFGSPALRTRTIRRTMLLILAMLMGRAAAAGNFWQPRYITSTFFAVIGVLIIFKRSVLFSALKSNVHACVSGYLCSPQNFFSHLHVDVIIVSFFGQPSREQVSFGIPCLYPFTKCDSNLCSALCRVRDHIQSTLTNRPGGTGSPKDLCSSHIPSVYVFSQSL